MNKIIYNPLFWIGLSLIIIICYYLFPFVQECIEIRKAPIWDLTKYK